MKLFVAAKAFIQYNKKVLLLRESPTYKDGTYRDHYDVVGGRIDPNESLFDALVREVKEESGFTVEPGEHFHIAEKFQKIGGEDCHVIRVYFAVDAPHDRVKLSDDHEEYIWIDPEKHQDYNLIPDEHDNFDVYLKKVYAQKEKK